MEGAMNTSSAGVSSVMSSSIWESAISKVLWLLGLLASWQDCELSCGIKLKSWTRLGDAT